eukprot:2255674-Prymnesium_polylepis.1
MLHFFGFWVCAPRETFSTGRADGGRAGTPAVANSVVRAVRTDGHVGPYIVSDIAKSQCGGQHGRGHRGGWCGWPTPWPQYRAAGCRRG